MSKVNRDFFSELVVGVFMIAVLALLGYFTIVISGVDILSGHARTTATIVFPEVGGLKERDNVVYRGMRVGLVERITLGGSNIVVTVKIDRDVVLRETAQATVAAVSLLGGNFLQLEEGTGAPQPLETTLFRGEPPLDWIRDLGAIARKINTFSSDKSLQNIVSNLEATADNLNQIVARVERGEGTMGKLLSKDDVVYRDLHQAVENVARISDRLEKGEGFLGQALSKDDSAWQDLKASIATVRRTTDRLEKGEGFLGQAFSGDDSVWQDLKATIANARGTTERLRQSEGLLGRIVNDKALADEAAQLIANLKTVSARIEKGEGALGKLTADSALYDELNALIKDVRQIVDNYRDTTPITTFGSLATGAL